MVQQVMDFIDDSWANVPQKEEIVDLDGNTSQHFQLMVPKKKKKKKLKQQQVDASKEFKVCLFNRSPRQFFDGKPPSCF